LPAHWTSSSTHGSVTSERIVAVDADGDGSALGTPVAMSAEARRDDRRVARDRLDRSWAAESRAVSGGGTALSIEELTIRFETPRGVITPVDQVSLELREGEVLAVVGESGCGKSTLALGALGLLGETARVEAGRVYLFGREILHLSPAERRHVLGVEVGVVFQASMNSFNPVLRIGLQIEHMFRSHPDVGIDGEAGREAFRELLIVSGLDPDRVERSFPHELSGGMKQRVAIASALALRPRVVILDEPTTALDVVNQRAVLDTLRDLRQRFQVAMLVVTHDLGVVAEVADRVAVMYAGEVVDVGSVERAFHGAGRHPYLVGLVEATPDFRHSSGTARPIPGQVPSLSELPFGCRFEPRCDRAEAGCSVLHPDLEAEPDGSLVRCPIVARPGQVGGADVRNTSGPARSAP